VLNRRFTFLLNDDDQQLLAEISKRLKRSQSDTVRFLIFAAAVKLGISKVIYDETHIQVTNDGEQIGIV